MTSPDNQQDSLNVHLAASVLSIRGGVPVAQPLVTAEHVLLWNGEIFSGLSIPAHANDTAFLFDALAGCTTDAELLSLMSRIRGPFAFVYFQRARRRLWFGRDCLGRRSLLWRVPSDASHFVLCSTDVAVKEHYFTDVAPSGLYCLDLQERLGSGWQSSIQHYAWGSAFLPHPISPGPHLVVPSVESIPMLFSKLLRQAVERRVLTIDAHYSPSPLSMPCRPSKVALLFSGGLDSTVLAAIVDSLLEPGEPIDLLNVSFENPRHLSAMALSADRCLSDDVFENVPDRKSGLASLAELRRLSPGREFRFVRINVARDELIAHQHRIRHLMRPNDSVLDWGIAAPFYFCGRAKGQLHVADAQAAPQIVDYTSAAKVLLLGFGADELLGGYGRHRVRFDQAGWEGLRSEMLLDFGRMWTRNLGRDDRCLSEFGREPRLPFLDEDLVSFLQSVHPSTLMDFSLARGLGEKLILRNFARDEFSLDYAAQLPKRAIQFGSKIAKMDFGTRNQQASDKFEPFPS